MRILTLFIATLAYASSARLDHLQYVPPHSHNQKPDVQFQQHADEDDYQLLEPPFDGNPIEPSLAEQPFSTINGSHTQEKANNPNYKTPTHIFGNNPDYDKSYNQNYPLTSEDNSQYSNSISALSKQMQNNPAKSTQYQPTNSFNSSDALISSYDTENRLKSDQTIPEKNNRFNSTSSLSSLVGSINPFLNISLRTTPSTLFVDDKESVLPTYGPIKTQNPLFNTPEILNPKSQSLEPSQITLEFPLSTKNQYQTESETPNVTSEISSPQNSYKNLLETSPEQTDDKNLKQDIPNNPRNKVIPILRSVSNNQDGTYQYAYETANEITAFEEGDARLDGTKAQGYYAYTSPEGKRIEVTYTADERGFIPHGDHIPTAPPIPKAIQKALDYIKRVEEERRLRGEVLDDGQYREEGSSYSGINENGMTHLRSKPNVNNISNGVLGMEVEPNPKDGNLQNNDVVSKSSDLDQDRLSGSSFLPFSDPTQDNFEDKNLKLKSHDDASLLNKAASDSLMPEGTEEEAHKGYTY